MPTRHFNAMISALCTWIHQPVIHSDAAAPPLHSIAANASCKPRQKLARQKLDTRTSYEPRLESLRGVAALMVALFHIGQTKASGITGEPASLIYSSNQESPGWQVLRSIYAWLANGHGAVVLFFVLSGYVLMQSLERSDRPFLRISGPFIVRRFLRLFPPVMFMVCIFWLVYQLTGHVVLGGSPDSFKPISILKHMMLLETQINGVTWTLQVEVIGAFVVLFAWGSYKYVGQPALWVIAVALFTASFSKYFNQILYYVITPQLNYFSFFYAFVAGMLIPPNLRIFDMMRIPPLLLKLYPVAGCALIFMSPVIFGEASNFRTFGEVIGSCALITGVVLGFNKTLDTLLNSVILRFYGRISYSFYLFHPLSLAVFWNHPEWFGPLVSAGVPNAIVAIGLFAVSIIMVTPIAMLSHQWVERPFIRLGKRFGSARPLIPQGKQATP
jgi:peptidoglycan/LPS O-acetylase OafA/YrhL